MGALCDSSARPNLTNFGKKIAIAPTGCVFFLCDTHALAFFSPIFLATVGVACQVISEIYIDSFLPFFRSLLTGGLGTSGAGSASGAGASGPGITPGGMGCNCNCNYNQVSPAASATGRGYDSYGPGYG